MLSKFSPETQAFAPAIIHIPATSVVTANAKFSTILNRTLNTSQNS